MYMLAKNSNYSINAVQSLRGVWVGGDVATAGLIQKTQETFPQAVVCGSHGMTEGLGAFGWPNGVPFPLPNHRGIFSCGITMPGFKIRITDEKRKTRPRGEPGELHICGDAMIERYLDGENPDSFYTDGDEFWFVTGDIAVLDKNDFVYVLSRVKDIIKRGGTPLTPACIEACILEYCNLPTQVIGIPSEEYGELPYCITEKPTQYDIEGLVLRYMGEDYALAPENGVLSLQDLGMSSWPINATGKIVKDILKRAAMERFSR
jgi:acyl-CoA synthetase (AMP-forming)/AMP-acid ligase II